MQQVDVGLDVDHQVADESGGAKVGLDQTAQLDQRQQGGVTPVNHQTRLSR